MKSIYIYGASGHGLVVADVARSCGYDTVLWIDDGDNAHPSFEEVDKTIYSPIVIGIGDNKIRSQIFHKVLQSNMKLTTLIHPSAIVSQSATIGQGTVVMPNVVINAESKIGNACILNSSSVIEHENMIGDFVHISPNVALSGNVTVLDYVHIGVGSSVIQGVTIGENSIIGIGSVVLRDIGSAQIAYGNPCVEKGKKT
ncbi:acetyltransferase [Sulfurovum sp.]|uniref:acetyltransferase n=1 Tax=Sulfurovum sp. TaxID=1969726 RepID=UPI002867DD3F|nr:acetyltransferase [Sulfurovum sp.]